jgi:hypothetical protein
MRIDAARMCTSAACVLIATHCTPPTQMQTTWHVQRHASDARGTQPLHQHTAHGQACTTTVRNICNVVTVRHVFKDTPPLEPFLEHHGGIVWITDVPSNSGDATTEWQPAPRGRRLQTTQQHQQGSRPQGFTPLTLNHTPQVSQTKQQGHSAVGSLVDCSTTKLRA